MKKSLVFMFLAAALALVCALGALGETTEPITVQREDGNLTVRIPVRAGDAGYWSCPLQDDSVVRIASVDADDAAYTVTFAPVADGAIDVEILHSNGVACDECHGFGLVVENGEIQEVESGYYTASSLEDDPLLDEALLGEWTDAETGLATMEIAKADAGYAVEIVAADSASGAHAWTMTVFPDCLEDDLRYADGARYAVEISDSSEEDLGAPEYENQSGRLYFDTDAEVLTLRWFESGNEEDKPFAFVRADGAAVGGPQVANPWVETDAAGVMQAVGVEFGIPEGAEDVSYSVLAAENLAEMRFAWEGLDYTARIKPAGTFEDISGLYYAWDVEEPCQVQRCEGVVRRAFAEGETVDLCLWFDVVPGVMYSVSTAAEDLDGFDIQAAAERLFVPLQGDAEGEASPADALAAELAVVLEDCAGYAGTAGASLKEAIAASELAGIAAEWQVADLEEAVLAEGVEKALAALEEERLKGLAENFSDLCGAVDAAFADFEESAPLFEDAGVAESMRALTESERGDADWQALKVALEARLAE